MKTDIRQIENKLVRSLFPYASIYLDSQKDIKIRVLIYEIIHVQVKLVRPIIKTSLSIRIYYILIILFINNISRIRFQTN